MKLLPVDDERADHHRDELRTLEECLRRVVESEQTLVGEPHRGEAEEADESVMTMRRLPVAKTAAGRTPQDAEQLRAESQEGGVVET